MLGAATATWAVARGRPLAAQAAGGDVKAIEVFAVSELLDKQASSGKPWLPFLKVPSLYCGMYVLKAGADDPQNPHVDDEVYYVESGRGKIRVNGEEQDVVPGGIIFVKAGATHKFHSIEEDLKLLVFFSSTKA
jgi:mannose-6-phosphate isomerase-like protein (cupin superfamily)